MVRTNMLAVVDFVEFKKAIKANPMEGGKAYAYLRDFMNSKINEETLFVALKQLNNKHAFMLDTADAETVSQDLRLAINLAVEAQFKAAK